MGVQNFPFLTTWPQKHAPKNTINKGVSAKHFLKNRRASRSRNCWTKKINSDIPVISFFASFFFCNNKNTPKCWGCVLANQKREFSKLKLKTLKVEKPNFCTCFLKKASFEKKLLADNWVIEFAKNRLKPHYKAKNKLGPDNNPHNKPSK